MNGGGRWWLSIASAMLVVLAAGAAFAGEQAVQLREARGSDVTTAFCATCHSLDYIEMNADVFDRAGWEKSVRKMIDRFGAPIPEEHARTIIAYLAENYRSPPGKTSGRSLEPPAGADEHLFLERALAGAVREVELEPAHAAKDE